MRRIPVKICGLKSHTDIQLCESLHVDILGFVVEYPIPVPWNLTCEQAQALIASVNRSCATCVVTGGSTDKIIALAIKLRPSFVQLHYQETLADTQYIVQALRSLGIRVIKTIPVSPEERILQFGTENVSEITKQLCESGVYAILLDSRSASNASLPSTTMDVALYSEIRTLSTIPVILAGGITPNNIVEVMAHFNPDFIDIMTGVEVSPGVKSEAKLRALLVGIDA